MAAHSSCASKSDLAAPSIRLSRIAANGNVSIQGECGVLLWSGVGAGGGATVLGVDTTDFCDGIVE
jgi:hypothetical protein